VKAEMALDLQQAAALCSQDKGNEPIRDKVRIRFRKGGDLRLVSHHDLMQCFERMLRRAALPFHSTEGFNPKPRMAFALSLALGVAGLEEVLELELDAFLPPEEIQARLSEHAPPGLDILSVRRIDRRTRAQVRRVCYRLPIPPERLAGLPDRVAALLAAPRCIVQRFRERRLGWDKENETEGKAATFASGAGSDRRQPPRSLDVRPYLRGLRLADGALEIDLWVTPTGTARPEEILLLLELSDLLEAGAVLERCTLELHDETSATDLPPLKSES
jgi:radical SAM-linked protein